MAAVSFGRGHIFPVVTEAELFRDQFVFALRQQIVAANTDDEIRLRIPHH